MVDVLSTLSWQVTVIDDRSDFADPARFPLANQVLCKPFESCLQGVTVTANSCIVVVTRGHEHDELALSRALETSAGYIGLIGSRGKIGAIRKNLRKRGIAPEKLEKVRAPVGIPIGSRTPEEIAISIAAELISLHRGTGPKGPSKANSSEDFVTSTTD